ncbi:Oxidative stress-induced growth inhibitor 1 [Wickerhamiella sorbophila]|uniref:Oxidative stress-induced growth inhibitor 1 n=1 Tax=Wickerhamiella sorbophila TaxID=45607 RepID=A0A2T0FGI3_9ASCO|nr:Oxidative stress-induced growth inhibitor 1 [Wickerhamiella sorbophila]PRT54095.1 Oxidative stress-induced growth inhibitor 1 [Wickerhamiella sorbophila]
MTVAIIGAGPAGLALAHILNGNIPHYDPDLFGPHPDPQLHELLINCPNLLCAATESKILEYVKLNVQSFFSSDCSPVSLLFDTLRIPCETNIQNQSTMESRVSWKASPENKVPYTLIGGKDGAGGQWSNMDSDSEDSRVLSYAEMLSLPGWAFSHFYRERYNCAVPDFLRPTRKVVAEYYKLYADKMGIPVTNKLVGNITKSPNGFAVLTTAGDLICEATDVVLASGISCAQTDSMQTKKLAPSGSVVVVGSGVSAADAVICAKPDKVLHIYKWTSPQGEPTPLRRYPKKLYPEYAAIFEEMKSRTGPTYTGIPNGQIIKIDENKVLIQKQDGDVLEAQAKEVIIRTGRAGSLAYAQDVLPKKTELVGKMSLRDLGYPLPKIADNVWAIGSLTGDSLVRYILGMSCAVAWNLMD